VIPQAQTAPSLEVVIRHFLAGAKKATSDTLAQSQRAGQVQDKISASEESTDLDDEPSADSLLYMAAHGADRSRSGRVSLTPFLKFQWETYRTVLEILRNHPKLEHLYAYAAQEAFGFCETYNRKNEFRRLCEILRNHLTGLNKPNMSQHQGVTLSNPETVQILLEVRFSQLNVATRMELWHESFRSAEDVHNLMTQSKRSPAPEMLCIYFERLTQIFWQAKNYFFHAYCCMKYFQLLQKLKADMSEAQTTALASQVWLAILSIPVSHDRESALGFELDMQNQKDDYLASHLGFASPVPRGTLISDFVSKKVIQLVYPDLQNLNEVLEEKLSPLTFGSSVQKILDFIGERPELKVYAKLIAENSFRRLMQQLSPIYQTIKLEKVFKLVRFLDPLAIERLLVESIEGGLLEARVDHQLGIVRFSKSRLDTSEFKDRLSSMSSRFENSIQTIEPEFQSQQQAHKKKIFLQIMGGGVDGERSSLLVRPKLIEKKKREMEKTQRDRDVENEANQKQLEEEAEKERIEALKTVTDLAEAYKTVFLCSGFSS
jgi:translation initiation factor 3 subunit A